MSRIKPWYYCCTFYECECNAPTQYDSKFPWMVDEEGEKDHENILMIYDLEYSYDVIQNCVIEQSIKPRTKISNDPLILTLKVSKGRPIMEDFIGKNLKDVEEFANHYELNLKVKGEEGIISSQTIKAGEVLSRGMTLSVTLK